MKEENQKWIDGTNVKEQQLKCKCGRETDIVGVSNWHNGAGLFYCSCDCGKQGNLYWETSNQLLPTQHITQTQTVSRSYWI